MRIAINAADLDHARIDGTRIYIQNLLKNFGLQDKEDQFLIYHKKEFNPQLSFPEYDNYQIITLKSPLYWTQTRFTLEMILKQPDVLWMPMQALPFVRAKKTKTVVTIHDLAFRFFPEHYPAGHVRKLNFFTRNAVNNADRIIAISNSTKKDILKLYPKVKEENIKVIYHGYDKKLFNNSRSPEKIKAARKKYQIPDTRYIIYVGAIQPRKNISVLLEAFKSLKKDSCYQDLNLVIAGSHGWLYEKTVMEMKNTNGVYATGQFETTDLPALLQGAEAFVFPSLYEGFGIPLIEAMACGIPVLAADSSSLTEIAANSGLLFDPYSSENLANLLIKILEDAKLRVTMIERGMARANEFSWEKSARETLEWFRA